MADPIADASTPVPQTSIGMTSVPQTSIGDTSVPAPDHHPYKQLHAIADANGIRTSPGTIDELEELLKSLNLSKYLDAFRSKGYDEVGDVKEMDLARLCGVVGLPQGHAERLLRHFEAAAPT